MICLNPLQEKMRLSLGDRMCSKQRAQCCVIAMKDSESKTLCYANSITAQGSLLCISLSAGGQRRPELASFPLSSPPLNPWAEFLNHSCIGQRVQAPEPPLSPINVISQLLTRGCVRDADSPRPLPR